MHSTALLSARPTLDRPDLDRLDTDLRTGSGSPGARARRGHRSRVSRAADWNEQMAAVDADLDRGAAGATPRVAAGFALLAFADLLVLSLLMLVAVYLGSA